MSKELTERQKAIVILSEMTGLAGDVVAQWIEESPSLQDAIEQGRVQWARAEEKAEDLLEKE